MTKPPVHPDREARAAAGSGGWKKPLFLAVLVFFLLSAAYYGSYVWMGREMEPGGRPIHGSFPPGVAPRYFSPDDKMGKARCRLYLLWQPLRDWERARHRARVRRSLSGVWSLEMAGTGPPAPEIRLNEDGSAWLRSADFPEAEMEGTWFTWEVSGNVLEAVLIDRNRNKGGVEMKLEEGILSLGWFVEGLEPMGPGTYEMFQEDCLECKYRRAGQANR